MLLFRTILCEPIRVITGAPERISAVIEAQKKTGHGVAGE